MKEFWLKENECTACGACANVCPKNAIELKANACGFAYPNIDISCIDCNACQTVCERRIALKNSNKLVPTTYAVWSKDAYVRYCSTSGGAFTEIVNSVLAENGYVVGAAYNDENLVEHIVVNSIKGLEEIRQSKYIQSSIGMVFREVKKKLHENKLVAFCGTPCQVAGLKAYLSKDYDNLLLLDFICRGVNSPKAFMSWLDEISKENGKKVSKVWFKYKYGGWRKSPRCTRVDFVDRSYKVYDQDENTYMSGYLSSNLYIRPSCGNCQFKGVPRLSDITLADFWGIEESLDHDKGTSMVLVNSEKGKHYFDNAKGRLEIYSRDFNEIFKGNVCFESSVKISEKSEQFLNNLDDMKFSDALRKYGCPTFAVYAKNRCKNFVRIVKKKILG